jgi:hypothetical protein
MVSAIEKQPMTDKDRSEARSAIRHALQILRKVRMNVDPYAVAIPSKLRLHVSGQIEDCIESCEEALWKMEIDPMTKHDAG